MIRLNIWTDIRLFQRVNVNKFDDEDRKMQIRYDLINISLLTRKIVNLLTDLRISLSGVLCI